jgi:mannan endo-1,4-beta-mannosidase
MREKALSRALHGITVIATAAFLTAAFAHPAKPSAAPRAVSNKATTTTSQRGSSAPTPVSTPTVDAITPLLKPVKEKYLGIAVQGVPTSMAGYNSMARTLGMKPGIVTDFITYGSPFDTVGAINIYNVGALPLIQWEPEHTTMATIAAGTTDAYVNSFAQTIHSIGIPVVISFGHEMNGDWYPWGSKATRAADFVAAWRHIHDLFAQQGAKNVIWLWDANVTYTNPNVKLSTLYPGDRYTDWTGLTGYYNADVAAGGRHTFSTLFQPSLNQIRTFTQKPLLIAETAAVPGTDKSREIDDLFSNVAAHNDIVGFVWFDYNKSGTFETNWRYDSDPRSANEFATLARQTEFHAGRSF